MPENSNTSSLDAGEQKPLAAGPGGSRPRVLSGMRPTGKLHLGNYMGALANWVKLQDRYECYFFIADVHALTTDYADTSKLAENVKEVAYDFLAAGLDPKRSTIFIQSHVAQHFELPMYLGMITPLGWLERVPSYKEMQENLSSKDLTTYGFLGYPVLMASDILLYQPKYVPVGQDQQAHVELTREIARRFNFFFPRGGQPARDAGKDPDVRPVMAAHWEGDEVLPEPDVLLTPSPKLPGTDGRKMSKSYGNTILLSDPEPEVRQKLKTWSPTRHESGAAIQVIPTSARLAICTRCFQRRRQWPRSTRAAGRPESDVSNAKAGLLMRWFRSSTRFRSAARVSAKMRSGQFLRMAAPEPANGPSKP